MDQSQHRFAGALPTAAARPRTCGCLVHDGTGTVLGSIAELVFDVERGLVTHAVVASGGFLGVGERRFAVPWRALRRHGAGFVLGRDDAAMP